MANNCLVTKLKEVVNNDNLPLLGWHGIAVTKSTAGTFNNPFTFTYQTPTSDVLIKGNAYFANESGDNLGKRVKANFHHIYAEAGTFYLYWKYKSISGNIEIFRCIADDNNDIDLNTEDISNIFNSGTTFNSFVINGYGNIAPLMQKLSIIQVLQFRGKYNFIGNNSFIGDITNIKPASIITIANTRITGTLESLLQKFASSIEKTIKFEITGNPGITYQGEVASFYHDVSFDGAGNYTILNS